MFPSYHHSLSAGRVSWPESAALAAEAGFPACDVWLETAMRAGKSSTVDALASNGLQPAVVDMPVNFRADEQAFVYGMKDLTKGARFAREIGCPRMTSRIDPSGPVPKADWRPIQLRRLQEIARVLEGEGVALGLEFVGSADIRRAQPHEFLWRMPEVLEFIEETGPGVGLLLDSWHWHYASATTDDIRKAGAGKIVHVHLNDAPEQFFDHVVDKERLMPGEGVIELNGFLRALQEAGYSGAVSVEVFSSQLKNITPLEGATLGYRTTVRAFERAGVADGL